MKFFTSILLSVITLSCNSQENNNRISVNAQIGEYVTGAYEDHKGHLWFGTLGFGIARYDGNQLVYFTKQHGLPSNRVTSVTQDSERNYWFNTGAGISKYDGKTFTTYKVNGENFDSNMISQFFIDSKGKYWVGTWAGVYLFDGNKFTPF